MPGFKEFIATFKAKGPEAEELVKETIQEISEVLPKNVEEAKKLAKEAKK